MSDRQEIRNVFHQRLAEIYEKKLKSLGSGVTGIALRLVGFSAASWIKNTRSSLWRQTSDDIGVTTGADKNASNASRWSPPFGAKLRDRDGLADVQLTFGITLASQRTVADWDHTLSLLRATLRSIFGQTDARWRVIICGHERPDIAEMDDNRIQFLSIQADPPTSPNKYRSDKMRKRHVLGMQFRKYGGGFFMQLDADDLVHRDLVKTLVDKRPPHGMIFVDGYAYDYSNQIFGVVPGVWSVGIERVCGSCSIINYKLIDLPDIGVEPNDPKLVFNMTRQHGYIRVVMEELGRPLMELPIPGVIYVVNHSQNLSFSMQKSTDRGRTIVERVQDYAIEDRDQIDTLQRDFSLAETTRREVGAAI